MAIIACGINHKRADIRLRERLAVTPNALPQTLQDLMELRAVNEAVLLSTCNRTEIIATSDGCPEIIAWLAHRYGISVELLKTQSYQHWGYEAVAHMMRVASGLDSMLIGEPQILGQVKQAYQVACDLGAVGSGLQRFFPAVFAASKRIRSETGIGAESVSLAFLVTKLAKRIFSEFLNCRVLFIGAGKTNQLIATHLYDQGIRDISVAGRSLMRAAEWTRLFGAKLVALSDLGHPLERVDLVVCATASQLPILGKGTVETAQLARRFKPLLLVDLAVPRDIEPEVGQLEDVYLYNLDDLQRIIHQNQQLRWEAAQRAEALVLEQAEDYMRQLRIVGVSDVIHQYRQQAIGMRDQEIDKALQQLKAGRSSEEVVITLAKAITNKLLHQPTLGLRQAAHDDEWDKLLLIKKIFGLK